MSKAFKVSKFFVYVTKNQNLTGQSNIPLCQPACAGSGSDGRYICVCGSHLQFCRPHRTSSETETTPSYLPPARGYGWTVTYSTGVYTCTYKIHDCEALRPAICVARA